MQGLFRLKLLFVGEAANKEDEGIRHYFYRGTGIKKGKPYVFKNH
jgi:hypothetical protein